MTRKTVCLAFASTLAAAALGGCDATDPLLREGMWHPTHSSHANTILTVANPADLVRGHGSTTTDAVLVTAPVERLEANKVKKLPEAGLSDVTVRGQGGNSE